MSAIKINDLRPVGADLFNDSESFLQELSTEDINDVLGGGGFKILWTGICVWW